MATQVGGDTLPSLAVAATGKVNRVNINETTHAMTFPHWFSCELPGEDGLNDFGGGPVRLGATCDMGDGSHPFAKEKPVPKKIRAAATSRLRHWTDIATTQ